MKSLALSENEAASPLVTAYAQILDSRIPDDCLGTLGFGSKEELVCAYFIDSVRGTFQEKLDENGVTQALDRKEFIPACLCYRPVDDVNGPVSGGEFLARRFDPKQGISSPGDWYQAMDTSGRVIDLDRICMEYGALAAARMSEFSSSSNISGTMLRSGTLPDLAEQILGDTGAAPERMHLELLENISTLTDDDIATLRRLVSIGVAGVAICIDDCGTENSESILARCLEKKIPIHTLKIDGAVTSTIMKTPDQVVKWGRKSEEIGAKAMVFEGKWPILLTPKLVDRLQETRDSIGAHLPWYIEGPVFPDKED